MNSYQKSLVDWVINSIKNSEIGKSKLNSEILNLEGMSSPKVRHLLNNICSFKGGRYLEIGLWQGSTFISALFGNQDNLVSCIGIDKWFKYQKAKELFYYNIKKYLTKNVFYIYEIDSFKINLTEFFKEKSVNIYFYDGNHSLESQELAFTYYNDIFDDTFIVIVDDFNRPNVINGTQNAFIKLKYNVLFQKLLISDHLHDIQNWWNGLLVAVISKK